jgi:hypothetical protein
LIQKPQYARTVEANSHQMQTDSPPPVPTNTAELDITRALVANGITGCGDMEYNLNPGQTSEYTVRCSRDSKNWKIYTVWPNINKVIAGPLK